jgi:serine/threonine-protein kinase
MATPPRTIGRYQIRRELGRGMMGVVYEAEDPVLVRAVALKTIQLAFAVEPAEREAFERRFLTEARTAARLSHPGIVVVHDTGREPETGTLYMALELLRGRPLDQVIREEAPLPWRDALRIAERVARALAHAHAEGVVHRDVKPSNVMVLPGGEPKIMDFGIAKVETAHLTATGQFFGTPLYMSPEQAAGTGLDGRSDLFSLGAVLYEMLTGRRAFAGEGVTQIVLNVATREPAAPSSLVAGVPRDVDALVARALAKRPADRYATGLALAEDARALLAGGSLAPGPPRAAQGEGTLTVARPVPRAAPATLDLGALDLEPLPDVRTPVPSAPPPVTRGGGRRAWIVGAAAAAAFVAAALVVRGPASAPPASPAPARKAPPAAPAEEPARRPRLLGPLLGPEPAQLVVDFRHPLRSGTVRVYVDGDLRLEQELAGRTVADLGKVKIRSGGIEETLSVPAGLREVRVRVDWDGKWKARTARATLAAGSMRRLDVRLSIITKELSMEWR